MGAGGWTDATDPRLRWAGGNFAPVPSVGLEVLERAAELLAGFLEVAPSDSELRPNAVTEADARLDIGGRTFVLEWKSSGSAAQVAMAAERARSAAAGQQLELVRATCLYVGAQAGRAGRVRDDPVMELQHLSEAEVPSHRRRS